MLEGVAVRLLCWHRGLTGWNEARQLVHSHPGESQERGRAGLQARARSPSQRGGLLTSEASWIINRDNLSIRAVAFHKQRLAAIAGPRRPRREAPSREYWEQ